MKGSAITSALLALMLVIGLSGCATQPTTPNPAQRPTSTAPEEQTPEAEDPAAEEPGTEEPADDATESDNATEEPGQDEGDNGDEGTEQSDEPEEEVTTPQAPPALHKRGDKSEEIREIQHRLLQLQWFEGEITDTYGPMTQAAVEGFQAKRELPVTGEIDEKTLEVLRGMTRKPTHDEMHNVLKPGPTLLGPGAKGDEVRDLQARMRQIGWYGAKIDGEYGEQTKTGIAGFQEKRGFPKTGEVDKRTLDKLHAMTRKPTSDELNNIFPTPKPISGMKLDERCMTGRAICISKSQRKLAWVVDGEIKMQMDVRFGSSRTPTREGTFSVQWKSRDHHSSLYDSPMPFALFFSGGQAVHFSSDFARRGYNGASKGCVNVRDKSAAKRLFELAKTGDKVIVYR